MKYGLFRLSKFALVRLLSKPVRPPTENGAVLIEDASGKILLFPVAEETAGKVIFCIPNGPIFEVAKVFRPLGLPPIPLLKPVNPPLGILLIVFVLPTVPTVPTPGLFTFKFTFSKLLIPLIELTELVNPAAELNELAVGFAVSEGFGVIDLAGSGGLSDVRGLRLDRVVRSD